MPHPHAPRPSSDKVPLANGGTIRQDTVVIAELVSRHRGGIRHGPMMCVVEEEMIICPPPMCPNAGDKLWWVPFVHDHELGTVERGIEIERFRIVCRYRQIRIGRSEHLYGAGTGVLDQIRYAPPV